MTRILTVLLFCFCPVLGQAIKSASTCRDCHSTAYAEWQASRHAHSTSANNRFYSVMYKMAHASAGDSLAEKCEKCHNPISTLDGKHYSKEITREGVNCDFCHATKLVKGPWFGPGPENTKLGPLEDAVSNAHKCEYSKFHQQSDFCLVCHGQMVNAHGIAFCSTQEEYENSRFAEQNVTCQDCHMPSRVGKTAPLGKIRENIHSHGFFGGYSAEMLRNCARLKVNPVKHKDGVQVGINVISHSIGHALPTASPMRLVVLNVEALNKDGLAVWRNFYSDPVAEDTNAVFMRLLQDEAGNAPVPPWQAKSVRFDNRLLPGENRSLSWTIPDTAAVQVRASLNYWLAPKKVLKKLGLNYSIYTEPKVITTVIAPIVPAETD